MRNFAVSFLYELKKDIKDVKMLAILCVFPIIMIYVLGAAVQSYFSQDSKQSISVGYVNNDTGAVGQAFSKFMDSKDLKEHMHLESYTDIGKGKDDVKSGKIDALVCMPSGLTKEIQSGGKMAIQIYGEKEAEFVGTVINSFAHSYNVASVVVSAGSIPKQSSDDVLTRVAASKSAVIPKAIDYYSVLVLFMVLIFGAFFGIVIINEEKKSDLRIRISALPTKRFTIYTGKVAASSVYMMLTSFVTILFSIFVYHANWNGNWAIIVPTLFVFCMFTVGLGMLIELLSPNFIVSLFTACVFMMMFSIFSGAITPALGGGVLGMMSPNYHAKMIIFGTIYGYSQNSMLQSAIALGGLTAAVFILSALIIRRKNHAGI